MAQGNGAGVPGLALFEPQLTPPESVPFEFGGQIVRVPVLNLAIMKLCKDSILSLGPGLDFISYAEAVVHIVHTALSFQFPNLMTTEAEMLARCSLKEIRELPRQMNELLRISGFEAEEADPTSPPEAEPLGTGTSTHSQPNLPLMGFAAEISTGSSDPILSDESGP